MVVSPFDIGRDEFIRIQHDEKPYQIYFKFLIMAVLPEPVRQVPNQQRIVTERSLPWNHGR